MAYGGVGGRGPARSGGPHVVGVAASGTYGSRRRGASRAADIGVALRRRRPPRGLSHSHAGRDRPGPTAREPVHVAGSSACRRRPGATTAGTGLRCRRAPALGHADGGLPLGSAVVFPAAAGPGLRRGSQSVPRQCSQPPARGHCRRSLATPPPGPALCYGGVPTAASPMAQPQSCRPLPTRSFGAGACSRRGQFGLPPPARGYFRRRSATPPAGAGAWPRRRWPPLGLSRSLAGRCRPGPTTIRAAGSAVSRRRPGASTAGAWLRRRRGPALYNAGVSQGYQAAPRVVRPPPPARGHGRRRLATPTPGAGALLR